MRKLCKILALCFAILMINTVAFAAALPYEQDFSGIDDGQLPSGWIAASTDYNGLEKGDKPAVHGGVLPLISNECNVSATVDLSDMITLGNTTAKTVTSGGFLLEYELKVPQGLHPFSFWGMPSIYDGLGNVIFKLGASGSGVNRSFIYKTNELDYNNEANVTTLDKVFYPENEIIKGKIMVDVSRKICKAMFDLGEGWFSACDENGNDVFPYIRIDDEAGTGISKIQFASNYWLSYDDGKNVGFELINMKLSYYTAMEEPTLEKTTLLPNDSIVLNFYDELNKDTVNDIALMSAGSEVPCFLTLNRVEGVLSQVVIVPIKPLPVAQYTVNVPQTVLNTNGFSIAEEFNSTVTVSKPMVYGGRPKFYNADTDAVVGNANGLTKVKIKANVMQNVEGYPITMLSLFTQRSTGGGNTYNIVKSSAGATSADAFDFILDFGGVTATTATPMQHFYFGDITKMETYELIN